MAGNTECKKHITVLQDQESVWINPIHGFIYQLKLLMLFLKRGLSYQYSFRLGTEIKEARKFDDLVFEYSEGNKKFYRLLQAKHKFDETKKITVDKLLLDPKGDYSLVKYFYSFQACKKDEIFKDGIIKDVIICTNIDFDFNDLKTANIELKKVEEKDDILEFLDHLVFAVNQPNEEKLGQIIMNEIGTELSFVDSENAYYKLLYKMIDLSMGKGRSRFFTHEEGKKFFDDLKTDVLVWFNIQDPISSFTGRLEYLKIIHEILTNNRHACISGMGGVGKTSLVRRYIADYGHEYGNQVVWISAESYRSAVDCFRQFASDKLNISLKTLDGKDKHVTSVITDVYQFLSKRKSLFIFDNAEKYKCEKEYDCGIDQFLPSLPGNFIKPNVIITSRNQKWPKGIATIKLNPMSADEARELVFKTLTLESEKEKEQVDEMCEKMQYLPLALQQAVAYIKMQKEKLACIEADFQIRNYLEKYSNVTHELLDFNLLEDSDSDYDKSVFATWNVTLDTLKQKENGQDALDILNIISFLLPDNIPIELLLTFIAGQEKLSAAIGLLKQYSIVSVQHKAISVHRLVQEVTRIKLQKNNEELNVLQNALKPFMEQKLINYKNVDQVLSIWTFARKYNDLINENSIISLHVIAQLRSCARYDEAIAIGNDVSAYLNTFPENIEVRNRLLILKNSVTMCKLEKGDHKTAIQEWQELYKLEIKFLGPLHNSTLTTKINIAEVFHISGKSREALENYKDILKACKDNEDSHSIVLKVKDNMSYLLMQEGKHEEALVMMREVHKIRERTLGNLNVETLATKRNIAICLKDLNQIDESIKILEQISKDQEVILPKNNPEILTTKLHIVSALMDQGQYTLAMENCRKLLHEWSELLGKTNSGVTCTKVIMAQISKKQKRYDKALEIFNDVLNQQKLVLGCMHPEIIQIECEIADIHVGQGKLNEAFELYINILKKQESVLGNSHLNILDTQRRIITTLEKLQKYDTALKFSLEALENSERIYGKNHPSTMPLRANVGVSYINNRNFDKALEIFTELLTDQENSLGKDHIDCQRTREYITKIIHEELAKSYRNESKKGYSVQSKELSKKESDINAQDEEGLTMLHRALNAANEEQVELLLHQGAEVFVTSNKGNTPLHIAALKGQEKFVKLLLQKVKHERLNDFVDAKTTSSGSTALHVAAKLGHLDIVKYLLKNRATFCCKTKNGKTPLDLATDSKMIHFLKMVHEMFEGVNQPDAIKVIKKLKILALDEFLAVTSTRDDRGLTLSQSALLNKQKQVASEILKMIQKLQRT